MSHRPHLKLYTTRKHQRTNKDAKVYVRRSTDRARSFVLILNNDNDNDNDKNKDSDSDSGSDSDSDGDNQT